jgi:hypothetical protein
MIIYTGSCYEIDKILVRECPWNCVPPINADHIIQTPLYLRSYSEQSKAQVLPTLKVFDKHFRQWEAGNGECLSITSYASMFGKATKDMLHQVVDIVLQTNVTEEGLDNR